MSYEEFLEQRALLGIRVEALRRQEAQYDTVQTKQKHAEVLADFLSARADAERFDADHPQHVRRMSAEVWSKMRPGRKIEDYPGSVAL